MTFDKILPHLVDHKFATRCKWEGAKMIFFGHNDTLCEIDPINEHNGHQDQWAAYLEDYAATDWLALDYNLGNGYSPVDFYLSPAFQVICALSPKAEELRKLPVKIREELDQAPEREAEEMSEQAVRYIGRVILDAYRKGVSTIRFNFKEGFWIFFDDELFCSPIGALRVPIQKCLLKGSNIVEEVLVEPPSAMPCAQMGEDFKKGRFVIGIGSGRHAVVVRFDTIWTPATQTITLTKE